MNLKLTPTQNPHFSSEVSDHEIILYSVQGNRFLHLNPTAALVWEMCDGTRSAAELIASLKDIFPDNSDALAADVEETLQALVDNGCIHLA